MIEQASLDPRPPSRRDERGHGALVQEIARNQSRLGKLARAAASGAADPDRLARLAETHAVAGAIDTDRRFEIASERLLSMSQLAAAARAADLSDLTRDIAGRQFETLKWQAITALREATATMRSTGAWQLRADPGQFAGALASAAIGDADQAAASATALAAALDGVRTLRRALADRTVDGEAAQPLDADSLARRIAEQAAKSADAQANIAPGNARLLLS